MLAPCGVSFSCIAARTIADVNGLLLASNSPAAFRVTDTLCSAASVNRLNRAGSSPPRVNDGTIVT